MLSGNLLKMEVAIALTALTLTFMSVVKGILTEDASEDEGETIEVNYSHKIQIKVKRK